MNYRKLTSHLAGYNSSNSDKIQSQSISVFISYARTNSAFVNRLEADLRARNFHTWVDRSKLEGGQNRADELEKAIQLWMLIF